MNFEKIQEEAKKEPYLINNFSSNFAPMVRHLYLKFFGKTCEPDNFLIVRLPRPPTLTWCKLSYSLKRLFKELADR